MTEQPFDLTAELAHIQRLVAARLDELVPPESARPALLHRAIRYSLLAPGKRIRPAVTLLFASRFGGSEAAALDPACAIEMVHAASLILDDLPSMDDATLRRGRKANHLVFGEDMAILAAVALLNEAFGVMARAPGIPPRLRAGLIDLLATAIGTDGVIAGQAVDLRAEPREVDFHTLEYIHSHKTGALFIASAEMGARLAGLSGDRLEPVRAYAKNLGLAFQILDDLLDRESSEELVGKNVRKDVKKTTFVSFSGPEGARSLARELISVAIDALSPFGQAGEPLRALAASLVSG